jgi:phage regulator Rha-like protein
MKKTGTKKAKGIIPKEGITNRIFVIRKHKVIMDFDLAELYEVETKYLKRQVKRNIDRFPADFMFELNVTELRNLRRQFGTSSWGGSRYAPLAFTEQGVAMLSGIISSGKAVKMNIAIMRAFVEMRKAIIHNRNITSKLKLLEDRLGEHDIQLNKIYDTIENLLDKKVEAENKWVNRRSIGFNK